ncbi:hypothetical protein ElyMa_006763900 [Elysia marginata]|uniref:Ig-like domain-containing protein n=1 Tax=Elysia marginata TaxID=1093978 RepID=A0AAV4IYC7_9GAST|nr:hypothetical protein ElyMa_006763900 [Elysia marginata]
MGLRCGYEHLHQSSRVQRTRTADSNPVLSSRDDHCPRSATWQWGEVVICLRVSEFPDTTWEPGGPGHVAVVTCAVSGHRRAPWHTWSETDRATWSLRNNLSFRPKR